MEVRTLQIWNNSLFGHCFTDEKHFTHDDYINGKKWNAIVILKFILFTWVSNSESDVNYAQNKINRSSTLTVFTDTEINFSENIWTYGL